MARDCETGGLIDPFNGQADIKNELIRCVGNPIDRFKEDRLRILRAIRFAITKQFNMHSSVIEAINQINNLHGTSPERIREELLKCFQKDTPLTLAYLNEFPRISNACFNSGAIYLKPTICSL
jgi:tRNA nucleotidyltransferase/poly(A) polymerase